MKNNKNNKNRLPVMAFILGILFTTAVFGGIYLYMRENSLEFMTTSQPVLSSQPGYVNTFQSTSSQNSALSNQTVERTVPVLAVSQDESKGIVGSLTVKLVPGNDNIYIQIVPFTETDLQYSADTAVNLAKSVVSDYTPGQDFELTYNMPDSVAVIGGGSAGAATTLATIAALEDRSINPNVAVTGEINPDGTIGAVSGLLEKTKAAADAGYTTMLIPKGETKIVYYERTVSNHQMGFGISMYNAQYAPKTIDLVEQGKSWGINVVEVSTIQDVEHYMLQ